MMIMRIPESIRKLSLGHSSRVQWLRDQSKNIVTDYRDGQIDGRTAIKRQEELMSAVHARPQLSVVE